MAKHGTKRIPREAQDAQSEHARIMEQAAAHPGVAEAMAVYGAVAGHVLTVRRETPVIRYATGGNATQPQIG
jgi:hypothetical protein